MAIKVIPLRDFLFIGRMAIKVSPQGFTSHTSAILLYGNTPVKAELAAGNRCGILRYGMVQWSLCFHGSRHSPMRTAGYTPDGTDSSTSFMRR